VGKLYLFLNWRAVLQRSFVAEDCWTWWTAVIANNYTSNCVTKN